MNFIQVIQNSNLTAAMKLRILEALSYGYGYSDKIDSLEGEIDNPQTKAQFANEMIKRFIRDAVKRYEVQKQSETFTNSITSDLNSI